ncbi:MAG: hypothetical protein AAGL98_01085 [Planctomycetota bacterium]
MSPQDILEASGPGRDEVVQRWIPFPGKMPAAGDREPNAAVEEE